MDGFDLGVGNPLPIRARRRIARSDDELGSTGLGRQRKPGLILGGAGLLAAFPLIYAVFLPALYLGVFLLLAGLIFRGVAFEFRFKAGARRYWWDRAFAWGSTVASFAQGAVVGAYIQGF